MDRSATQILILNYNGRGLLAECLPSVVAAAQAAPMPCGVTIVDNGSTDDSLAYLSKSWPDLAVIREPNRGLASFNSVLARIGEPVVLLLNNDVKLEVDAIAPLVDAIHEHEDALFSAPLCWTFDGTAYEGMRTRVKCRYGLIQGMCRTPGHLDHVHEPDMTAAAGPILAVHRERFLALGGYDPVYFPGRIEDLDLGFRGWMAGWKGYYVPSSVAYHRGFGSFEPAFGKSGCDRLAARNSLFFAWKNLSGLRLWNHLAWLPARVILALLTGKKSFLAATLEAFGQIRQVLSIRRLQKVGSAGWNERQEAYFQQFHW